MQVSTHLDEHDNSLVSAGFPLPASDLLLDSYNLILQSPVSVTELICTGTEQSVLECSLFSTNSSNSQFAAVRCMGKSGCVHLNQVQCNSRSSLPIKWHFLPNFVLLVKVFFLLIIIFGVSYKIQVGVELLPSAISDVPV